MAPFEQNFGIRRIFYVCGVGLYWNLRLWRWFRVFWKHPEADVFWYSAGPFCLTIEPKD